jgi:biopolymer transport protein ExbD
MRFIVRKRRQTPAVIIVALIDVLIVMLIFLLVTTSFKQQPALRLALPESSQTAKAGANEDAPLVVSVDPQGNIRLGPDGVAVTAERLLEELTQRVRQKPGLRLAINADKSAPFGQIVKVMDASKAAGIKTVNAFTKQAAGP